MVWTPEHAFALVQLLLSGIQKTFGRRCEVVLHDFRNPEQSILAIEGSVTERHVGGAMTQIGLSLLARGDDAEDQVNYMTRTPTGRVLKSTTMLLRQPDGHVFGALCINFDVTDLRIMASGLQELAGTPDESVEPRPVAFFDEVSRVLQTVIDEETTTLGVSVDRFGKSERVTILERLNARGVFAFQRSVPLVAEALGISRATAYKYLETIRTQAGRRTASLARTPAGTESRNGSA
jgi:predicted transcriptional regulator YheO